METVVIVGGGFSGTMAAVHLARLGGRPLRVVVVNRGHPSGRGVAYGTRRPEHLLNVAARKLLATGDRRPAARRGAGRGRSVPPPRVPRRPVARLGRPAARPRRGRGATRHRADGRGRVPHADGGGPAGDGPRRLPQRAAAAAALPRRRVPRLPAPGPGDARPGRPRRGGRAPLRPAADAGANPAIAVDKLRPHTQRVWQAFSLDEKREFCRRHAARWNVARHRIPESVHARLMEAVAAGTFRVVAGRVRGLADAGGRVRVTVEADGGGRTAVEGGLVVNCTGPQTRFSDAHTPLFRSLLARGLARPDGLDMGLDAAGDFAVIGGDGRPAAFLYAIGPLLRGTLWETTAVPELRGQALRVAQTLLGGTPFARSAPADADVIEYRI